jgi:hypothetical protein
MTPYEEGKAAHAAGTALTDNPHPSGADQADWAAGWSDAQAEAVSGATPPPATPPATADSDATDAPAATETATSPATDTATEVVESLGDVGHARILDLLANPPIGDITPGTLPESGEVPEDLGDWLEAWKAPLAFITVDTAIGAVKTRLSGSSRGRLKELYRGMSPMEMTAAMQANADTIAEFADERVAEAGIINSLQASVTQKAAGFLLNALLLI